MAENSRWFRVSETVAQALARGTAVLALESTIFTHGLPRPRNLEVALEAEDLVREAGVVPATVGVVGGVATVGLDAEEIRSLGKSAQDSGGEANAVKASLRDLPVVAAQRRDAGTTVAATAYLAHRAGVRVFSTGGLGGVHHGASETFDESADLPVLARTPVLMVSAGVKSVLDVAASLERLETLSIPVVGYRSTRFPGFYVADSGHTLEYAVRDAAEAAALVESRDDLGLDTAVVVANPVPVEQQLAPAEHDRVLAQAWAAAREQGVLGHDTTPFLLDHIQAATEGRSLEVNVAAYRNNVALGAEIAAALAGPAERRG